MHLQVAVKSGLSLVVETGLLVGLFELGDPLEEILEPVRFCL
jgi:hypothetical protein